MKMLFPNHNDKEQAEFYVAVVANGSNSSHKAINQIFTNKYTTSGMYIVQ